MFRSFFLWDIYVLHLFLLQPLKWSLLGGSWTHKHLLRRPLGGPKHLLTRYLEDVGRLGLVYQNALILVPMEHVMLVYSENPT